MAIRFEMMPDFDFGGEEYAGLYAQSRATVFQHPLWLANLYGRLLRDERPIILGGYDDENRLCVVLPLIAQRLKGVRIVEAPNLGVTDYVAPIIRADIYPVLHRMSGLHRTISGLLPPHDVLRIKHVRDDRRDDWALFFAVSWRNHAFAAHHADLTADFPTWRAGALSDSFRRYLDRKEKRLAKAGKVELVELTDPAEFRRTIDYIAEIRSGRFENDGLQLEHYRAFYAALAVQGMPIGLIRTYALRLDGEDMGRVLGLVHASRFHFVLTGSDYGRHGKHSPGLVMVDLLIGQRIAAGDHVFDFTIGDEGYKREFGTVELAMVFSERAASLFGLSVLTLRQVIKRIRSLRQGQSGRAKRFGETDENSASAEQ